MHNELTNLLPPERRKTLSLEYVLRVGVIIVVLITALTLVASVLLIPTYVLLSGSEKAKREHLAGIESSFSSADEAALSARLAALSSNTAALITLSNSPSASAAVRAVLAVSRPGITLSNISYTPPASKSPGALTISGTSETRDALRSYQTTLQEASFVRSAALPVSAYAKDTDIAFTIAITLAP